MKFRYIYQLFIGLLIKKGHKLRAELLFNQILGMLKREYNREPMEIIEELIVKVKSSIRLKPIIVAGITYKLPMVIDEKKEYGLAARWILESANNTSEKMVLDKLYKEMINIYEGVGGSLKKEEIYRTVLINRAFMKYLEHEKHSAIKVWWLVKKKKNLKKKKNNKKKNIF